MIEVYSHKCQFLGEARSFGEARRMQEAALPAELRPAYAGIQDGMPIFYTEFLTEELVEKYFRQPEDPNVPRG